MTALAPRPGMMPPTDDYEGEESRFAIYSVARVVGEPRRRIAETSLDGIGLCLQTLRDEDEISDSSRIGILDRLKRSWLINPFARGDLE